MGLAWLMVGVLADEYDLYLVEGTEVESIENESSRWINGAVSIFGAHEVG